MKFFKCPICGNIIISKEGKTSSCCHNELIEIKANTSEAATEKHIPIVNMEKNIITIAVGEIPHPMTEEHYIQWIYIVTNLREIKYNLKPNDKPEVKLTLEKNEILKEVYSYCNLHSLWLNELE